MKAVFSAFLTVSALAPEARAGDELYLTNPFPAAAGFDEPQAASSADARAVAAGRVSSVGGNELTIEHLYYENYEKKNVFTVYSDLSEITVAADEVVFRGQKLGTKKVGAFGFQLRGSAERDAKTFLRARRKLFLPPEEEVLVLVDQENYRLALYHRGVLQKKIEVGFGQAKGRKERQGDLKTPKGMYFVTHKQRGEFPGRYGGYYGGHWIKLNYPNTYDAERGVERGWIKPERAKSIAAAWEKRELTDQKTALGGGIGLHGWIEEWDPKKDGSHLSWGCVVLHLRDISAIFDAVPVGSMVVIW
jgi:hypothetical protein